MFPIRKIVAPTDFSEESKHGLKAAIEVAQNLGAKLIIVHVNVKPIIAGPHLKEDVESKVNMLMESLHEEVLKHLNTLVSEFLPSDLHRDVKVVEGDPAEKIIEVAKQEKADMIVMATNGHSGFNLFICGSVTEKVVRRAHCPVLTIRPQKKD